MNNLNNSKTYRAVISAQQIKKLRNIYFKNAFVFICRNLIHSKVFENGLCLREANEKECIGNPLTKQLMQSYWLPFGKDIIDSIFCIGLVPVRYKKQDENVVPYVPKAGTYEIHVVTEEDGSTRYEFFSNDKPIDITKPTPDAFVLSGFGYDPERNGSGFHPLSFHRPRCHLSFNRCSGAAPKICFDSLLIYLLTYLCTYLLKVLRGGSKDLFDSWKKCRANLAEPLSKKLTPRQRRAFVFNG